MHNLAATPLTPTDSRLIEAALPVVHALLRENTETLAAHFRGGCAQLEEIPASELAKAGCVAFIVGRDDIMVSGVREDLDAVVDVEEAMAYRRDVGEVAVYLLGRAEARVILEPRSAEFTEVARATFAPAGDCLGFVLAGRYLSVVCLPLADVMLQLDQGLLN